MTDDRPEVRIITPPGEPALTEIHLDGEKLMCVTRAAIEITAEEIVVDLRLWRPGLDLVGKLRNVIVEEEVEP